MPIFWEQKQYKYFSVFSWLTARLSLIYPIFDEVNILLVGPYFNWQKNLQIGKCFGQRKEGNVLFNDALNTFYLWLYGIIHIVKDYSGYLLPHYMGYSFQLTARGLYMTHPADRIAHTTVFGIPVVEHWLEQKVFQTVILNDTHTFLWMVYQFWMNKKTCFIVHWWGLIWQCSLALATLQLCG